MRRTSAGSVAIVAIVVLVAASGCDLLNKKDSPTAPSPTTASLDQFAGTFTSPSVASVGPASCGNLRYVVAPTSTTAATVTFTATCAASIEVSGSGTGTLSGSTLGWSAQGTVTQGAITCPFAFTNGTAAPEGAAGLRVSYAGTVCGIAVSGTEIVAKS
jgi:hypothetical protein